MKKKSTIEREYRRLMSLLMQLQGINPMSDSDFTHAAGELYETASALRWVLGKLSERPSTSLQKLYKIGESNE